MKKFLTVLLVIAVMFTFSFSSAFATTNYNKSLANEYFNVAMNAVKDSATGSITVEGYEIKYSTLEANKDALLEAAYAFAKASDPQDYASTAGNLVSILEAAENSELKMALVSAQYKADKADALTTLNGLSLADFSTEKIAADLVDTDLDGDGDATEKDKDECETYQEHVQHLINDAVKAINDADSFTTDSTVADYTAAKTVIGNYFDAYADAAASTKLVVEKGYEGKDSAKVGLGVYEINKKFVVEGSVTLAQYTTDAVKAQGAVSEADVAAVKAIIAQKYAAYLADTTKNQDKAYAADMKKVLDYLADQKALTVSDANGIAFDESQKAAVATAIDTVEKFEAEAAQLAAETDENGVIVRDAKDVADYVAEGKVNAYGTAVGLTTPAVTSKKTTTQAITAIKGLHASLDSAKLAYAKELRKSYVADLLDKFEDDETYYPAELAKVKAVTDEYLAKVNAVTELAKVDDYDSSYLGVDIKAVAPSAYTAAGKLTNIETAATVDGKSGALKTAAKQYADLLNSQISKDANKYYLGTDPENGKVEKLDKVVNDIVGNSTARTAKEITALSEQVLAAVKELPTKGEVEAADEAVVDAVKALPSTVTTADKAKIDAAKDALKAYKGLTAVNHARKADVDNAVMKYAHAVNNDITAKVKAVNTLDKAAIKAIKAEIKAFTDAYGSATKPVFQDNKDKLDGYLAKIRQTEATAVTKAISAIPVKANLTDASKDEVEAARKLYDAYVAEYTDTTDYDCVFADTTGGDGFVADDFDYASLVEAETLLGITATEDADENAKAYVQDLKIVARSVKTAKGNIKVTVKANVQPLIDAGYKVEYKFFRSTKARAKYELKLTKTKNTYTNTTGKKGVRYYYKAKLVVKNAAGEVVAVTPLTQCRYACRVK